MDNINQIEYGKKLRENIEEIAKKLQFINDGEMSCCGITVAQSFAIVQIGRLKNISLIDLAKLLNLDNSTISRTINNLVTKGFVQRDINQNDRRYITISLTDTGRKIFEDIENNMTDSFAKLYVLLPEDKRLQVLESLEILTQIL